MGYQVFRQKHASPYVLPTDLSDQRRPAVASQAREPSKNTRQPSCWPQRIGSQDVWRHLLGEWFLGGYTVRPLPVISCFRNLMNYSDISWYSPLNPIVNQVINHLSYLGHAISERTHTHTHTSQWYVNSVRQHLPVTPGQQRLICSSFSWCNWSSRRARNMCPSPLDSAAKCWSSCIILPFWTSILRIGSQKHLQETHVVTLVTVLTATNLVSFNLSLGQFNILEPFSIPWIPDSFISFPLKARV